MRQRPARCARKTTDAARARLTMLSCSRELGQGERDACKRRAWPGGCCVRPGHLCGALRELFNACSHASGRTLLDFETAAMCSPGHEALLRQGFGGNFGALLAWWRSQRIELR
jgi:hypothetical protein